MKRRHYITYPLLAALSLAGPVRAGSSSFDDAFHKVMPLCEKYFLPNSMALAPGVDPQEHQKRVEARLNNAALAFRSPDGVAYLRTRLRSESDSVAAACIRHLERVVAGRKSDGSNQRSPSDE